MKPFNPDWTKMEHLRSRKFEPDFRNILAVLERKAPSRPTLFEFFLHDELYEGLSGMNGAVGAVDRCRMMIRAFHAAGYDYTTLHASDFSFPTSQHMDSGKKTFSQTHGGLVTDRTGFDRYPWPDPDTCDYSRIDALKPDLPKGMKFIVYGPGGVLENVIQIIGYEDLCYMMVDDMPTSGGHLRRGRFAAGPLLRTCRGQ